MTRRRQVQVRAPSPAEFAVTLSAGEGQFVEFKESVSDSLAREFVAFANSGGGRIFLGVADDRSVRGTKSDNRSLALVQDVARHCDPPVAVHVVPFRCEGHSLLMVDVPEGERKPYGCSGGYYLRAGATTQRMNREELLQFVRSQGEVRFDEMPCVGFRYPGDFNAAAFRTFLAESKISSADLKREDLLVNVGVASPDGSTLQFNNAGVLFFARNPRRFHLQSRITCLLFQGSEKSRILDRKDFDGSIVENVKGAMTFLEQHISVRYEITGLKRLEVSAVPPAAMREALLNAVIHRDYFERGGVVMVDLYRDRLEISNPGGLVAGLTLRDLGRRSLPRNPLIADLFLRLGAVERAGTGIQRIRESVAQAGLKAPVFESDLFFSVTFPLPRTRGNVPFRRLGAPPGTKSALSRHQADVLSLCRTPRTLVELLENIGRSDRTKFRVTVLGPLLEAGLVALTVPDRPRSRFQKYVLTTSGEARLRAGQ